MRLINLIKNAPDIEIKGITADSRQVRRGYLFAAISGHKTHGQNYIEDAIQNGAICILSESDADTKNYPDVYHIQDDNPRLTLAKIAKEFYKIQPSFIAAVTGTSGKTSTVRFTEQLWQLHGIGQSASLGTLGVHSKFFTQSGVLTTPDTVSLHATLADLTAVGITHLAIEASSHGLHQYRLDGLNVMAAGYTNLSRDHLDYHPNMDEYFDAKARLFSDVLMNGGTAVLNADDPYFQRLYDICIKKGHRVITYGFDGKDIQIISRDLHPLGQALGLNVFGKKYEVLLPLVGEFQAMNALCALGLVLSDGYDADSIVPLLSKLSGVEGRLQLISGHPLGAAIYVDYAHKPAALEAVLNTLRPHTNGKLYCVFGCGGNRDAGKRSIMGRIACGLCDVVVVTDDNPRFENASLIRASILEGAPDAIEIADRRQAISWVIQELQEGDVLVVAGKGHEQGQIIGDVVEPFDDASEASLIIKKLNEEGKNE